MKNLPFGNACKEGCMMLRKILVTLAAAALILAALCCAASGEVSFSANTERELGKLVNGPVYLPAGLLRNAFAYSVSLADDTPIQSATLEWISGDEAMKDYFYLWQNSMGGYLIQLDDNWTKTGTVGYRLTVNTENGSIVRDLVIDVLPLEYTESPVVMKTTVAAQKGAELDLNEQGILYNPDGFEEAYLVERVNEGSGFYSAYHEYKDEDGQRYSVDMVNGHTVFHSDEVMTFGGVAHVRAGVNLIARFNFEIQVTETGTATPSLQLSSRTRNFIRQLETGPIYLPIGDFENNVFYEITLNNNQAADTVTVEWLDGEPLLKNMFVLEQHGGWYMGFAPSFGGAGTAAFRLTASSGEDSVSREFTVTVSQADPSIVPTQAKTVLDAEVNVPVDLTTAGIMLNPQHYQESYRMMADNRWTYSHDYQDADGERFTFGSAGTTAYSFTAGEAGTYPALIRANLGINLLADFYFDIVAVDTGKLPAGEPLFSGTEDYIRSIENGPVYVTDPNYLSAGSTLMAMEGHLESDSVTVEFLEGEEQLRDIFFIGTSNNQYFMGFREVPAAGTATFRLTIVSGELMSVRDFTITATEPDYSQAAQLVLPSVTVQQYQKVNLNELGVLNNPAGSMERYGITVNELVYFNHSADADDGLGFKLELVNGNRVFTPLEPGTYTGYVQARFGVNMAKNYYFDIVVEEADEPIAALAFSPFFQYNLQTIEQGPTYLPFGEFSGTAYRFPIELENSAAIDSASVEWVSGEEALKHLFYTSYNSTWNEWSLCFNNVYGGTGTAAFRISATSGNEMASQVFSVTVTEMDASATPAQLKTAVEAQVGQTIVLQQSGIISNPAGLEETYMVAGNNNSYSSAHDYEDEDGLRYTLSAWSGLQSFIAQEAGTYKAIIQLKPSYNLTKTYFLDIVVTDTTAETAELVLAASGYGANRTLVCDGAEEWVSSDESVAGVSNGLIYSVNPGQAVVEARDGSGHTLLRVNVTVREMATLTLPAGLKELAAEALSGTAAERIILPDTVTSVAPDAFAGCSRLRVLYIPAQALPAHLTLNGQTVVYTIEGPLPSGADYPVEVMYIR